MLGCCRAAFVRATTHSLSTNLAVATSMLLWVKVLAFLKMTHQDLATFVAVMIDRIVRDLSSFLIFFLVILLMFACAFYLYLGPRHNHDFDFHSDREHGVNQYSTFLETLYSLYLFGFLGDFDGDNFDKTAVKILLVLFVAIVAIVLLNVLIAIVSESYAEARKNSTGIYYRLRIELITETRDVTKLLEKYNCGLTKDDKKLKKDIEKRLLGEFEKDKETEANVETQLADVKSELEAKMAAMQAEMSKKLDAILEKLPVK